MPSVGVKRIVIVVGMLLSGGLLVVTGAAAAPLGTTIPANCVEHHGFPGEDDVPGDVRCAGLAIDFHTGGVAASQGPIWAGQWLFVDEAGQYRVGSCTLNRGVHPTIAAPSTPVDAVWPRDPGGAKAAYLAWRYGDTTDDLTAAALWAVLHFYAQDAAGSRRAADPAAPLVPALDRLAIMTGNAALQATAVALDAEAQRLAQPWTLDVSVSPDGGVAVAVRSGRAPVGGVEVVLDVGGAAMGTRTGDDGVALFDVGAPVGRTRIVATAPSPGRALVYRGRPAWPDPQGGQTLVTGGSPETIGGEALLDVPDTTPVETTTEAPPTEVPTTTVPPKEVPTTTVPVTTSEEPTTTVAPTTTASAPTTEAPPSELPTTAVSTTTIVVDTTTTQATTSSTTVEQTTTAMAAVPSSTRPRRAASVPMRQLPRTGGASRWPACLGVVLLVAGVGLLGASRRRRVAADEYFDWSR